MIYLFLFFAWLLSACANHAPIQFYMLNAETDHVADASARAIDKPLTVGLGPIHLPAYLDRPQIVVAVTRNQYRLEEQHRWAERLDENIGRALAQLLGEHLGVERVVHYPWAQKQPVDYQIGVDILELHQAADGISRLRAQWQLKVEGQAPISRRFDCGIASRDGPDAIVKAQSLCLGRLGLGIVNEVRRLADGNSQN